LLLLNAGTVMLPVNTQFEIRSLNENEMHLVQLLLPLHDNRGQPFPTNYFSLVRAELTGRFGGVTAFIRSPALGLWEEDRGQVTRDDVVMFEVLVSELDKEWWARYRNGLEQKFKQDELLLWASEIIRL